MRDVFLTFLRLGLTSFGGPLAHLGYFRREFVERRAWIDAELFGQIVAFCSVLPGPTSSQVGMIVGLLRAGPAGALGAWLGFTLPSATILCAAAALLTALQAGPAGSAPAALNGLLAGLAAAATAIVAQAVLAMARAQCPDAASRSIAAGAAILALALAGAAAYQWVPIAVGAGAGALLLPGAPVSAAAPSTLPPVVSRAAALIAAAGFAGLVAIAANPDHWAAGIFVATIVRAGSLVFGGGHVVLPLLQSLVPAGLVSSRDFFAGYGITQAMPGPIFTFAAFLGSVNRSPLHGLRGAAAATVLIFLPSFLLVFALWPLFGAMRANRAASAALRGANAAVVGLLGALLYSPLITGLGSSVARVALALAAFTLVTAWNVAPWIAVIVAGLGGLLAATLGFPV